MMDAVEFLKEVERMCSSYDNCTKCQLHKRFGECSLATIDFDKMENTVSIVEQWSKEHQHPVKTNRDVLIDLVEEHFGSNYGWHSNGLDDSIRFNFTNGFLDEEYKGKSLEQTEDKLSFEEAVRIHKKICDGHTRGKCTIYTKSGSCVSCEGWCFDHPKEVQQILLDWKKKQEEGAIV